MSAALSAQQLEEMEARAHRVLTNGTTSGSARALAKNVVTLVAAYRTASAPRDPACDHTAACLRAYSCHGCSCKAIPDAA